MCESYFYRIATSWRRWSRTGWSEVPSRWDAVTSRWPRRDPEKNKKSIFNVRPSDLSRFLANGSEHKNSLFNVWPSDFYGLLRSDMSIDGKPRLECVDSLVIKISKKWAEWQQTCIVCNTLLVLFWFFLHLWLIYVWPQKKKKKENDVNVIKFAKSLLLLWLTFCKLHYEKMLQKKLKNVTKKLKMAALRFASEKN